MIEKEFLLYLSRRSTISDSGEQEMFCCTTRADVVALLQGNKEQISHACNKVQLLQWNVEIRPISRYVPYRSLWLSCSASGKAGHAHNKLSAASLQQQQRVQHAHNSLFLQVCSFRKAKNSISKTKDHPPTLKPLRESKFEIEPVTPACIRLRPIWHVHFSRWRGRSLLLMRLRDQGSKGHKSSFKECEEFFDAFEKQQRTVMILTILLCRGTGLMVASKGSVMEGYRILSIWSLQFGGKDDDHAKGKYKLLIMWGRGLEVFGVAAFLVAEIHADVVLRSVFIHGCAVRVEYDVALDLWWNCTCP